MTKTAVEWIRKELEGYGSPSALNIDWETFDELIAQAKAMEKEQIIEAHDAAYIAMNLCFPGYDRSVEYYENNYGENRGSNQSITGKD